MSGAAAQDEERQALRARRRDLERRLIVQISCCCAYFLLVGGGALIAILLLLDRTRTRDLGRVGAIALAGGALGATVRGLYVVMQGLERGEWELADGTIVSRRFRRQARAREQFLLDLPGMPRDRIAHVVGEGPAPEPAGPPLTQQERAELEAAEQERVELGLTRAEYEAMRAAEDAAGKNWALGPFDLPNLILAPFLGAALGLVSFAGLVSGFLVASGSGSAEYSPTGLLFIAGLAGLFAPNFIGSLARAADAIFGPAGERPVSPHPPSESRYE
jgi:hypothetical protein